jgi:hypothetical protein
MSERITTGLRRLARPPVLPRADHRENLEVQLAARFGTARKETNVFTVLLRAGVVAGLVAAVGAGASQLPATWDAEVGKRVEIRLPPGPVEPGSVQAAVKAIEGGAAAGKRRVQVRARVTAEAGKGTLVRIDAFGDTIGMDGIPDAIRAAVPAFARAEISVQPVDGKVEGDLGGLVGAKVLGERPSAEQLDAAARRLEAEAARLEADAARLDAEGKQMEADAARLDARVRRDLAASGVDGDVSVDVKSTGKDGEERREIRVIVTKEKDARTGDHR